MKTSLAAAVSLLLATPASALPPPPPEPAPEGAGRYDRETLTSTPAPELARRMVGDVAGRMVEFRPREQRFYGRAAYLAPGICKVETMSPSLEWPGEAAWVRTVNFSERYRFTPDAAADGKACAELSTGTAYFDAPSQMSVLKARDVWKAALDAAANKALPGSEACTHLYKPCDTAETLAAVAGGEVVQLTTPSCDKGLNCYQLRIEHAGSVWIVDLKAKNLPQDNPFSWVDQKLVWVKIGP